MTVITRLAGLRQQSAPGTISAPPGSILFSTLGLNANDPFTVAAGVTVIIDISTPSLGYTDIAGTVRPNANGLTLTTTGINIQNGGALELGTEGNLITMNVSLTGAYVPLTLTTIAGFTQPTNPGTSRAIMVQPGGRLDLHGTSPTTLYTNLNASAALNATSLTLATAPGWASGDQILISPTDFLDIVTTGAEQRTLSGATSGTTATISAGLTATKWGLLQYPIDVPVSGSGMSLTPGTFSANKGSASVPVVLDERARVINLNRGISISCPNDPDWSNKGHGVTIMWMASGTTLPLVRIEGVQIRRGGNRGATGRYPFHAHMNSYTAGTGAFTADTPLNYVKKSVVWDSENRAYTIHGTCGMEVSDCVSYNVKGHPYFLEDGSERRNTLRRNMAVTNNYPSTGTAGAAITSISGNGTTTSVTSTAHGLYSGQTITVSGASISGFNVTRYPVTVTGANTFTYLSTGVGSPTGANYTYNNDLIKNHDIQTSGYWITNPDNTIEDNYACASLNGHGAWMSIAPQCFGLSALVACAPDRLQVRSLKGFTCHSNFGQGLHHKDAVSDEAGTFSGATGIKAPDVPQPGTPSYGDPVASTDGTFFSTDHRLWKNSSGGYSNNVNVPRYQRWVVADNGGTDFFGSTNNGGTSSDHLGISVSLNNANPAPSNNLSNDFNFFPRAGFATYHGTVRFFNNTWINYAYAPTRWQFNSGPGNGGGVFEGGIDYYDISGVDLTNGLNTGNKLINSHYGAMCPPNHLDGHAIDVNPGAQRHYAISQVWLDSDGKYGAPGKYMLPISPGTGLVDDYYLSGATNLADGPVSGTVVCKTTDTKYCGIGWTDTGSINLKFAGTPVNGNLTSYVYIGRLNPLTVTRQDPTTGATIGTPFLCKRGDTSNRLAGFNHTEIQVGGRFQVDFKEDNVGIGLTNASPCVCTWPVAGTSCLHGLSAGNRVTFSSSGTLPTGITAGTSYYVLATGLTSSTFQFSTTPGGAAINTSSAGSGTFTGSFAIDPVDSMVLMDLYWPGTSAINDYVLLGIPWANASVPRICYGSGLSNENEATFNNGTGGTGRNTFASAADVTAGRALIPNTSGLTLAAALADTTGMTYYRDTTNNRVWIRFTNRNSGGTGPLASSTVVFGVQQHVIVIKV